MDKIVNGQTQAFTELIDLGLLINIDSIERTVGALNMVFMSWDLMSFMLGETIKRFDDPIFKLVLF